jgi:hypothetical protein
MQLSEVQRCFQQYIFNQEADLIKSVVAAPPTDTVTERLAVYADAYEARLIEVLEKTFPALKRYSGEEIFYEWCSEYLYLYPSVFYSVSKIGHCLSIFLKDKNLPLQSEIAALEWAINVAVDAANALPVTKKSLEAIPQEKWGDLILTCHPSLQTVVFNYNTIAVYEALMKDSDLPEIKVFANACRVWRKDIQIYYLTINTAENIFLDSIAAQRTFGEICEKLAEQMSEDEVVNYAIGQILTWLQDELITGIKVSHELA